MLLPFWVVPSHRASLLPQRVVPSATSRSFPGRPFPVLLFPQLVAPFSLLDRAFLVASHLPRRLLPSSSTLTFLADSHPYVELHLPPRVGLTQGGGYCQCAPAPAKNPSNAMPSFEGRKPGVLAMFWSCSQLVKSGFLPCRTSTCATVTSSA